MIKHAKLKKSQFPNFIHSKSIDDRTMLERPSADDLPMTWWWSYDFLPSDGHRQAAHQSPPGRLPIAVGTSPESYVTGGRNRAIAEQSHGGGRQTSLPDLLRHGSRSRKSGDDPPMP